MRRRLTSADVRLLEDRLDVDDGRSVDRLDRTDAQAVAVDRAHGDRVKPQRVGPIRRARREHAGQRVARVGSRVRLRATLAGYEAIAGGASVTIGLSFEVEDQAKPACVAEVIYRYYA